MAETIRVVLDNFWSWLGTFLIVAAAAEGFGGLIKGVTGRKSTIDGRSPNDRAC
jgi:hypothetical protein